MRNFFTKVISVFCCLQLLGGLALYGQWGTLGAPFDAGVFTSCGRTYVHTEDNTGYTDEGGMQSGDIFYRFEVNTTVTVSISHCGSSLSDTYVTLLNSNGGEVDYNDDYGPVCSGSTNASIIREIPAGTYYVRSEGYHNRYGIITTSIVVNGTGVSAGLDLQNPILAGLLSGGQSFSETRSNAGCYYSTIGYPSPDIYYKFQISKQQKVHISLCGSSFDTYVHLLDGSGTQITTNDDNGPLCAGLQSSISIDLDAGTYYVVAEGYGSYVGNVAISISVEQDGGGGDPGQEGCERTIVDGTYGVVVNPMIASFTGAQLADNTDLTLTEYVPAGENSRSIRNIVSLSIKEESTAYIPENFSATVNLQVQYGHNSVSTNSKDITLVVDYSKEEGLSYKARKYFSFENAAYVNVHIVSVLPSVTNLSNGVPVKDLLLLENEMRVTRYYSLASTGNVPSLTAGAATADELPLSWSLPSTTGHNQFQLEWSWLEGEMATPYEDPVTGLVNTDLLFRSSSTRIDLPESKNTFNIPLLYDGKGILYYRMRAVNAGANGVRAYGAWTEPQEYGFEGHSSDLNWQATTSYAEEGKHKTVIQYFDGSLRSRQTVTKDNVTNSTVVAETFYDALGRAAVQILPTPGISNSIGYTSYLNRFNGPQAQPGQQNHENPATYFDLVAISNPNVAAFSLNATSGAAKYYSAANTEGVGSDVDKNVPQAEGYPYTLTRYTPDGTGRIAAQSGVGLAMRMGGGRETKYYYGTPAQEELDGLFGTEAGYNSHYAKNMVQDANGQMSISYVDMNGRTIATALAGDPPPGMSSAFNTTDYPGQGGTPMVRNLLDKASNIVKGNTLESFNTILVPVNTMYEFRYKLDPVSLELPACPPSGPLYYDCMYNLEITITDESGDTPPVTRKFHNIDPTADDATPGVKMFESQGTQPSNVCGPTQVQSNVISFCAALAPGSYSIRKTLTLDEKSVERYKALYLTLGKGYCKSEQEIIDSIQTELKSASGCESPVPLTCAACMAAATNAAEIANCRKLCTDVSHKLELIRSRMCADMIPYTGQYAKETPVAGAMYAKYDIFSTANPGQPFYKYPQDSQQQSSYYFDAFQNPDVNAHEPSTKLSGASKDDFATWFTHTWTSSLLPHHPEYPKLKYAEDHLQPSYDWIVRFDQMERYSQADSNNYLVTANSFGVTPTDPFFIAAPGKKAIMAQIVSGNAYYGTNLWAIAYGEGGCKTILDKAQRDACYALGVNGPPFTGFTAEQHNRAWMIFKALYQTVRDSMVTAFIDEAIPSFTDEEVLLQEGYTLHFPTSKQLVSQTPGWGDWYPATPGGSPTVNVAAEAAAVYDGRCSGYINSWKQQLLLCPAIAAMEPTARETVLNEITAGMEAVCRKGTDDANPFGASTVAPGTPYDGSPRSFEEVIEAKLTVLGIPRDSWCNPHMIESPKPHGKGPVFSQYYISTLDTCTCSQFGKLKLEASQASYNPNVLSTLNQYLQQRYGDTLTTALFNAMQTNCGLLKVPNCPPGEPADPGARITGGSGPCPDTVKTAPLAEAQPLPVFLRCGFVATNRCLTCDTLNALTGRFKTYYNSNAPYTGDNLDNAQISQNVLYAQYLNFYTGFQYQWTDYTRAAREAGCALGGGISTLASNSGTVLCRSNKPIDDTAGVFLPQSPCEKVIAMSVAWGSTIYKARTERLLADFEARYRQKCLEAAEEFTVSYSSKEYHYTLYYYDRAGNLLKTVPPRGARPDFTTTFTNSVKQAREVTHALIPREHLFVTSYRYNSLNQVVAQNTPDAGTSRFWYDKLGRLLVSQNAEQNLHAKYSYTWYDDLGRIIEVGQKPQTTPMSQVISQNQESYDEWFHSPDSYREQITGTMYDDAYYPASALPDFTQQNLRNRVSYTYVQNLETDPNTSMTFYSYDVHGNVDGLLQDYQLATAGDGENRFKRMYYEYDLASGKVNKVSYQPGIKDAFYHRYSYDAENRITAVSTSRDDIMWEKDVRYKYYKHGPLARTVIGQQGVQAVDYNYTLQGWLKGINQVTAGGTGVCAEGSAVNHLTVPNRDANTPAAYTARQEITFTDGFESGINDFFETFLNESLTVCPGVGVGSLEEEPPIARDAYHVGLNYYNGDYKAISGNTTGINILNGLGTDATPLYNGNIAAMSVNIPKLGDAKVYNYHYDQLNRLTMMDAYNGLNVSTGAFTPVPIADYKERVSYDPNGNIKDYLRNGTTAGGKTTPMDNLHYEYKSATNQLLRVSDAVGANDYTEDIKGTTPDYQYDQIGNLTYDESGNTISWNVYGKILSVVRAGSSIQYTYDAAGNRISKKFNNKTTLYVRDASGNVMSVYEREGSGSIGQVETHLYGSSRLGIQKITTPEPEPAPVALDFGDGKITTFTRGEKFFELSNHLGNVLATVSDKKIQVGSGSTVDYYTADIKSAQDYYPFGMMQPGRSFNAGGYRYGFNGKENDNEAKGEGNQQDYGMRIYDPRLGRFLSVDPITKSYPELTPYQFASNRPLDGVDRDGLEWYYFNYIRGGWTESKYAKSIFLTQQDANAAGYLNAAQIHKIQEDAQRRDNAQRLQDAVIARNRVSFLNNPVGILYEMTVQTAVDASGELRQGNYVAASLAAAGLAGELGQLFRVIGRGYASVARGIAARYSFEGIMSIENNFLRGALYEAKMANTYIAKGFDWLAESASKFFPTIDFYNAEKGVAVSFKTVNAKSNFEFKNILANIESLKSMKAAGSKVYGGIEYKISEVELHIATPAGYDRNVLKNVEDAAERAGVKIEYVTGGN